MAQRKTKIITTTGNSATATKKKGYVAPHKKDRVQQFEPLFEKKNFIIIFAGLLLIAIGFILMSGGKMPSPDVWEPERIYSLRRVFIAPIFILAGLGLSIYSVFKK